jgi:hypothetical protein
LPFLLYGKDRIVATYRLQRLEFIGAVVLGPMAKLKCGAEQQVLILTGIHTIIAGLFSYSRFVASFGLP